VREQARELNRLERVLEGANIKLRAVDSTMVGRSVRAMLEVLVAEMTDSAALAEIARAGARHAPPGRPLERLGYRFILDRGSQPDSEVLPRQRGTQEALPCNPAVSE